MISTVALFRFISSCAIVLKSVSIENTMAEIINLNKKRKAKARVEKEKKASINRIKFGRTKKEKQIAKQESERHERLLDGHKLEDKENE